MTPSVLAIALTVVANATSTPPIVTAGATRTAAPQPVCATDPSGDVSCILNAAPDQRIVIRTRSIAPICLSRQAQVVDMPGRRAAPKALPTVEQARAASPCV